MKDSCSPALVLVAAVLMALAIVYAPRILAALIEWGKTAGVM